MKRPSRHHVTPKTEVTAASQACSWLCPAVGCSQTEPGGRLGSPGRRVPDTLLSPSPHGVTASGTRMTPPSCFVEDGARRQAGTDERATEHESA